MELRARHFRPVFLQGGGDIGAFRSRRHTGAPCGRPTAVPPHPPPLSSSRTTPRVPRPRSRAPRGPALVPRLGWEGLQTPGVAGEGGGVSTPFNFSPMAMKGGGSQNRIPRPFFFPYKPSSGVPRALSTSIGASEPEGAEKCGFSLFFPPAPVCLI